MSLELRREIRITDTHSAFIVRRCMWARLDDDSGFKQVKVRSVIWRLHRVSLKQYISHMHSFLDEFGGNW